MFKKFYKRKFSIRALQIGNSKLGIYIGQFVKKKICKTKSSLNCENGPPKKKFWTVLPDLRIVRYSRSRI